MPCSGLCSIPSLHRGRKGRRNAAAWYASITATLANRQYRLSYATTAPLVEHVTTQALWHSRALSLAIRRPARITYFNSWGLHHRQYNSNETAAQDRRIYILGLGAVGKLVAHSLAGTPDPPPITILMHRENEVQEFNSAGRKLQLLKHGVTEMQGNYDVQHMPYPKDSIESPQDEQGHITNLIIAINAYGISNAIRKIQHRLTPDSTILVLSNVMGILDEIYAKCFQAKGTAPNILLGRVSHAVTSESSFSLRHAGVGSINMSLPYLYDSAEDTFHSRGLKSVAPSTRYILRTISRAPILGGIGLPPVDFLQLQLERLAIDSIIHPLTALYECNNGQLLGNFHISRLMFLMLAEISLVLRSLPELQDIPEIERRFSTERLRRLTIGIIESTSGTESSMLRDWSRGKPTEIAYTTGYVVRRGEELGIRCLVNYSILQMVMAKRSMLWKQGADTLPLENN